MLEQIESTASREAPVLQRLVERAKALYSLPAVAARVLELTDSDEVDLAALKSCLENDPALTVKLLRVVNSSLFGLTRQVHDLGQALALLGAKPLKLLVLGFSLPRGLFADLEREFLERYWRRALLRAVAAREISGRVANTAGDDAFLAGLLYDLGQLTLARQLGEPYLRLVATTRESGGDLITAEQQALGFDHAILSARMLETWKLPESLVRAIAQPHEVEHLLSLPGARRTLPQVLHLADLLSRVLAEGDADALARFEQTAPRYFRLSDRPTAEFCEPLQDKTRQLADVLAAPLGDEFDPQQLLTEAHERLASAAEEAAGDELSSRRDAEIAAVSTALQSWAAASSDASPSPCSNDPPDAAAPRRQRGASNFRAATSVGETAQAPDGFDPGLSGRVQAALAACRVGRLPLSLLFACLDGYENLPMALGPQGAGRAASEFQAAAAALCERHDAVVSLDEQRLAVVLPGKDRQEAIELARHLAESQPAGGNEALAAVRISVGVAALPLPPKNFPGEKMLDAAERCCFAAQAAGGGVKSVELL